MTATAWSIPSADEKALRRSLEQGFRGIKIKGGDGDAANDERVVKGVRALLGPDVALMIDFNQSLDPAEATRRIARLAPYDLHWIEEPVPQENLSGHAKVRETSPTPIQAGENWWFPRGFAEAIAAGASDFIMPDLMKCGGVTGWLQVAAQAEAANIPMSSHLFAEASAHVLAVTPTAHWLEFLDFARAILAHPAEIVDGTVTARGPGLGLEWNETAVAKYLVCVGWVERSDTHQLRCMPQRSMGFAALHPSYGTDARIQGNARPALSSSLRAPSVSSASAKPRAS